MSEHCNKEIRRPKLTSITNHRCGTLEENNGPKESVGLEKKFPKDNRKISLIREVQDNKFIRFKFILSICVSLAYMTLGWAAGQIGPAFPDLIDITSTDLEKGSAFMTSYFTGRLVGSALGGILYSKMDTYLMFLMSMIINGAVVSAIPWCSFYEIMITAHALHGTSGGVLDIAVTSTAMSIWGPTTRGDTYIHILYVFNIISTAIAPIVTAPFLREIDGITEHGNVANLTTASTGRPKIRICCSGNSSSYNDTGNVSIPAVGLPDSTLYIAYFISAAMTFLVAFLFLVLYIKGKTYATRERKTEPFHFIGNLPRIAKYLQFINIGIFSTVYFASDLSYTSYLTVFCVQYLHWTKPHGAMLTSVTMFSTLGGTLVGIFLVRVMNSHIILLIATTLYTLGFVCMTVSAHLYADIGIWISVAIIGLPLGVIWPCTLSWINTYLIPVGGKIASYLLVLGYLGPLLCPSLLGYLMQEVSFLWFCYVCIIESAIMVVNALFMVLYTIYSKRNKKTYNVQISTTMSAI